MNLEFRVGRPVDGVSDASAVFKHIERTLAEIVHDKYCMSKQDVSCFGKPFLLLEKKPFQSVEGLSCFVFFGGGPLRCHGMQIKKLYVFC